jgi:flagellar motor switch protein FliN/FliY
MDDDGIDPGIERDALADDLPPTAVAVAEPLHDAGSPAPTELAADLADAGARLPIEALGQVELKVEVVLGRARLRLQELLDVRPGQSVELDRTRNSPVDVLVNGTLFARGDIVVIDDTNLGVRVSEVIGNDFTKEPR